MSHPPLTIMNDGNMRGIIAPVSAISESLLNDIIDVIEMAEPKFVARVNRAFKKGKKHLDGRTLRKELRV